MNDQQRHMETCFLCRQAFQFGPGRYDGKYIQAWKISVCRTCHTFNHDGLVPGTFPQLLPHLQSIGVAARLNSNGWIDWPS